MSSFQSNGYWSKFDRRALDLRDLHDRVHAAKNHATSARALIRGDALGAEHLDLAIDVLDSLLRDLRWGGIPG
jgi:hypothetical protein